MAQSTLRLWELGRVLYVRACFALAPSPYVLVLPIQFINFQGKVKAFGTGTPTCVPTASSITTLATSAMTPTTCSGKTSRR